MTDLRIELAEGRRMVKPGESVEGRVSWTVDRADSAEVRLFWYTRGKGTQDVGVVDTVVFSSPQATDQRTFRFTVPEGPYTFSGTLISIVWAIELIVEPGSSTERREIVVSPIGREIRVGNASA
jgi:hypothetical protein